MMIAFEGIDGSGKTTHIRKINEKLNCFGYNIETFNFPDRKTESGIILNKYLTNNEIKNIKYMSLLFALNRMEKQEIFWNLIKNNHIILLDRYKYSGIIYWSLFIDDIEWLNEIDKYNIEANLIIFIYVNENRIKDINKGKEIYEKYDIMVKLNKKYYDYFTKKENVIFIEYIDDIEKMNEIIFTVIKF